MTDLIYLLPVWETISTAWEKVKGAKASFWGAIILIFVITGILAILSVIAQSFLPGLDKAINIISQVLGFLLQMGLLYMGIQRAFNLPITYSQLFRALQPAMAIRLIGAYLLQTIVLIPFFILMGISVYTYNSLLPHIIISAILGTIATIGMIYVSIRLSLTMGFVLDKACNPWQAIKQSFATTHHNVLRIIGLICIETIIFVISLIPLGIGLIWTLPFVAILYGVLYKNLTLDKQATRS